MLPRNSASGSSLSGGGRERTFMRVDVNVVPYDSGQRASRMGRGPEVLIADGLPEQLRALGHDVSVHTIESTIDHPTETAVAFDLARSLAERVRGARDQQRFPLVLAGNCMAALGVMAGLGGGNAVVWLDAHGDFNTPETTRTTFLDGMSVAVLVGSCWSSAAGNVPGFAPTAESAVALIGTRDLDAAEAERLARSQIHVVKRAVALDADGLRSLLHALRPQTRAVYLHVDLDVLDPVAVGPANRFAAPGGFSLDDVRNVVRALRAEHEISAATISAYDPSFDSTRAVRDAAFAIIQEILAMQNDQHAEPITTTRI